MSGCYDRRGDERIDQFRCDPDPNGDLKSCCEAGNSCASNGLCISNEEGAITPYYIHGCTVDDWDVESCPTQCYNSTGNGIQPCGGGMFCCFGRQGCDCDNEDEVFSMGSVRVFTSIPLDATHETTSTSVETTTTSITTSSTTSATSAVTTTALPAETTQSENVTAQESDSGMSIGLGVGLGAGIPVILILLGIVWFVRRRRAVTHRQGNNDVGFSVEKPDVENIETATMSVDGLRAHPSTLSKHHPFTDYFSPVKEQSSMSSSPPQRPQTQLHEAPTQTYIEMEGAHYRREMDTDSHTRYELPP